MPAFGFQKQFVMPILTATKTSTIRKERKDGRQPCKPGDTLKLYYGMRTKQCELISEVRCKAIYPISIQPGVVDINGNRLHKAHMFPLARMEGFKSPDSMLAWFIKNHGTDLCEFTGWHIQWEAM